MNVYAQFCIVLCCVFCVLSVILSIGLWRIGKRVKDIFEAILQIDMDYYKYSNNATQMNNNFNNAEIIRNAMLSIEPTINPNP